MVAAPGFIFAEPAIRSGWSSVMLPLHVHVLLLVLIEHKHWYAIVRLPVVIETRVWIVISFLQHLLYFLDVNGWSQLSFSIPLQISTHGMHRHSDAILSPALLPSLKL